LIDVVQTLERIIAEGREVVVGSDADLLHLRDWLCRRQQFLDRLDHAVVDLATEERQLMRSLIAQLLQLDSMVLDRIGARLGILQAEIGAAGKLKTFLNATGRTEAPNTLSRAV
jgi:hypothetical protein